MRKVWAADMRSSANTTGEEATRRAMTNRQLKSMAIYRRYNPAAYQECRDYIDTVSDAYVRRLMELRYAQHKSWLAVSIAVGGYNSPDSVRKIVIRWIEHDNR
jgi:hypothetical protein